MVQHGPKLPNMAKKGQKKNRKKNVKKYFSKVGGMGPKALKFHFHDRCTLFFCFHQGFVASKNLPADPADPADPAETR